MKWKKPPVPEITAVLIFLLLMGVLPAWAGELLHPLQVKAEISTGKQIIHNTTIPVTVDITNMGEDFTGRVEIYHQRSYDDHNPSRYYQDIHIPANTPKRYHLFIPSITYYYQNNVIIRVCGGKNLADYKENKVDFTRVQYNDIIMMVLNPERSGYSYIADFKKIIPQNSTLYINHPDPSRIPINWKCYDNIKVLMINNLPALNLKREAEKAILGYVNAGGCLVFSSNLDPNEFSGSLFKDYLPISPRETKVLKGGQDIFTREDIVTISGDVNGLVEVEQWGTPILLRRQVGEGCIYFITADLSKRPFQARYEESCIWKKIMAQVSDNSNKLLYMDVTQLLNRQPELAAPPVGVIFWILFIYIILIGPVNYLVLKKKDRLGLLFVTVPIISLLFSSGIFFLGYSIKGSRIIMRTINITYLLSGQSGGLTDSMVSLFSPNKAKYNLALERPGSLGWETGSPYENEGMNVSEDEPFTFENLGFQMWSMRRFQMQNSESFPGPITLDVRSTNKGFSGKIQNDTGKTLTGCVIIYRGQVSPVFDLPPGEKKIDMEFAKDKLMTSHALADYLKEIYNLKDKKASKDPMFDAREAAMNSLAESVYQAGSRMILTGWSKENMMPVGVNKKKAHKYDAGLFFVR